MIPNIKEMPVEYKPYFQGFERKKVATLDSKDGVLYNEGLRLRELYQFFVDAYKKHNSGYRGSGWVGVTDRNSKWQEVRNYLDTLLENYREFLEVIKSVPQFMKPDQLERMVTETIVHVGRVTEMRYDLNVKPNFF